MNQLTHSFYCIIMFTDFTAIDKIEKIRKSGISDVFTPSTPVSRNFFCGRTNEVERILTAIVSSKSHILLFGDRGVGKTSLAQYVSSILVDKQYKEKRIEYRCGRTDSFGSVMNGVFQKLNISVPVSRSVSSSASGDMSIIGGSRASTEEVQVYSNFDTPSWVVEKLIDVNVVITIDEFDTIPVKEDKEKFSQLIKLLSDAHSSCVLIIVGIALSAAELLEGHMSVARSLAEVSLPRMNDEELEDIINKGEARTQLRFEPAIKSEIVQKSMGFPYFTHLMALRSAEEAVVNDIQVVSHDVFLNGLKSAINNIEQTLKDTYDYVAGDNTFKKSLLYCAALIGDGPFKASALREKYQELHGEPVDQLQVNNAISKALSDTPDTMLRKVRKGVYFFNDPRMPVYITMRHVTEMQM